MNGRAYLDERGDVWVESTREDVDALGSGVIDLPARGRSDRGAGSKRGAAEDRSSETHD